MSRLCPNPAAATAPASSAFGADAADSGVVRETLQAHVDPLAQRSGVNYVAFSPTGQLASVGMDETVRLWCSP